LISHGFKKYNMKDVARFFDPLRLKLLSIPLSEVPNSETKSGSDYYFVQGCKYFLRKDYQMALNVLEKGI
jgi:hypothetical protein